MPNHIFRHILKQIKTFIAESDYKIFREKAQNLHLSEYALLQKLTMNYLHNGKLEEAEILHKRVKEIEKLRRRAILASVLLSCYASICTTYILVF